jgi:hypothetical protein
MAVSKPIYYQSIFWGQLGKSTRISVRIYGVSHEISNPAPLEYKSRDLPVGQPFRSVHLVLISCDAIVIYIQGLYTYGHAVA